MLVRFAVDQTAEEVHVRPVILRGLFCQFVEVLLDERQLQVAELLAQFILGFLGVLVLTHAFLRG